MPKVSIGPIGAIIMRVTTAATAIATLVVYQVDAVPYAKTKTYLSKSKHPGLRIGSTILTGYTRRAKLI